MRIKRVLQGTALAALAAAAWMGAGTVDAAAADADNVFPVKSLFYYHEDEEVSLGDGQTLFVNAPDSTTKEIIFGVGTYNANKKTVKITSWDVYDVEENGYVEIDLSKLNNTKDNYIAIKSESTNPVYIRITGSIKSQKLKYAADTDTLTISDLKTGSKAVTTAKAGKGWEYRTSYGNWETLDVDENKGTATNCFSNYQGQGASIYVRAAANLAIGKSPLPDKVKDANDKSSTPTEYPLYEGGNLPGKEKKFSIKKQANGPKVTIDYTKGTIKIPDKTEYRVFAASGSAFELITPVDTATKKQIASNSNKDPQDVKTFLTNGTTVASAGVIEVRKAAVSGKTAPSKWTRVDLAAPKAFTDMDKIDATANVATSGTVNGKVTVDYDKDKNGKFSKKNSITITNSIAKKDINVVVAGSKPSATEKKFTTIKATKSKSIKVTNGNTIYIRTAGNKNEAEWAGEYTAVGKIAIPADPTPTPTAAPAATPAS